MAETQRSSCSCVGGSMSSIGHVKDQQPGVVDPVAPQAVLGQRDQQLDALLAQPGQVVRRLAGAPSPPAAASRPRRSLRVAAYQGMIGSPAGNGPARTAAQCSNASGLWPKRVRSMVDLLPHLGVRFAGSRSGCRSRSPSAAAASLTPRLDRLQHVQHHADRRPEARVLAAAGRAGRRRRARPDSRRGRPGRRASAPRAAARRAASGRGPAAAAAGARPRFSCCDRLSSAMTIRPLGGWRSRTAELVLLRFCPPGPLAR